MESALDEFLWTVNCNADRLATKARDNVLRQEMEAKSPILLDGMRAGYFFEGNMVHHDLKKKILHQMHSTTLQHYLTSKYSWSHQVFRNIDWKAHEQAMESFSLL